ncbi:MAG: hypothetical protein JWR38_1670 [Mucilaginibacter sp.]|nr:hypothetical protein [Mucilaginibacter sp.]
MAFPVLVELLNLKIKRRQKRLTLNNYESRVRYNTFPQIATMKAFFLDEKTWAITYMFTIFMVDIIAPRRVAFDVLYICCILIVFKQNRRTIILSGLAAIIMIIINCLFDSLSKIDGTTLINHGISVVAVLITSYIAVHYQTVNEHNHNKERKYVAELQEMLFITSHKARRPVANLLGLLDLGSADISIMSRQEIDDLFFKLNFSAEEVDELLKELNRYIESINHHQL